MSAPWDAFVTERDRKIFAAAGYGTPGQRPKRPALLLVDFTAGNASLPGFDRARDHADRLARAARTAGLPVIHLAGAARPDGWDRPGTNGRADDADPVAATGLVAAPEPQDIVIRRQAPSGFFDTDLSSFLNLLGADGVVLAGGQTAGALRATAIDAFSLNLRVLVAADACFDAFEASHALTLCDLDAKYADPLPTAEITGWPATPLRCSTSPCATAPSSTAPQPSPTWPATPTADPVGPIPPERRLRPCPPASQHRAIRVSKKALAGLDHVPLQELRRRFSTVHAKRGTPIHVSEKPLNQVSSPISDAAAVHVRHKR